jgi:hypothetical protein
MRLFALDGIVTAQHSTIASDLRPITHRRMLRGVKLFSPLFFDNKGAHKDCLVVRGAQLVVSRAAGVEKWH